MMSNELSRWLKWPLALLLALGCLYLVANVYLAGQPVWAVILLVSTMITFYVYLHRAALAFRYLLPGLAAMLVFVAFPLVYTAQIGFTNYSSAHLLGESRARDYLLEQMVPDESQLMDFDLYRASGGLRIVLTPRTFDGAAVPADKLLATPPVDLRKSRLQQLQLVPLDQPLTTLGAPLNLKERLAYRDGLMALKLARPDGVIIEYAGVREFGPQNPVWKSAADGSLTNTETGAVYTPNRDTGYFEDTNGDRLQPGFKVGVGFDNYKRMVQDENFRGPFFSIFIWTVVFAFLTVLCSLLLGGTLAVMLNWEALRYRTLYRTLLFLPYAVPGFISILVFKGLFNQNFGEINAILNALFGIKPAWFADPTLAKLMLLIVNVWLGYPYMMVLCTGLLKAIPSDLYEASALAGAGPWTNFIKITAPLIIKPLTPLLISAFAFNFNNFVLISLLTDGRPDFLNTKVPAGMTDILVSYTYRIAFRDSGQDFGLAAAISTVIFILVAAMSLANLKISKVNQPAR
ncbi:maltose ABC transporter permease MalF [Chitinimonas sp. BJYL2]|uniref:maltose ABC transporter permease MalF n=1 Tax=Chitinimonas sp. BJYL2 TaxID=2976696 RepID=UPI0022B3228B|nr:maltose ABC transporter permease MalF [Chitinimonas sp. BJYL2]